MRGTKGGLGAERHEAISRGCSRGAAREGPDEVGGSSRLTDLRHSASFLRGAELGPCVFMYQGGHCKAARSDGLQEMKVAKAQLVEGGIHAGY